MRAHEWTDNQDAALCQAWLANESMDRLEGRMKISRSCLYRRAQDLGLDARQPEKRRQTGYVTPPRVPKRGHPLVIKLFRLMRAQRVPVSVVAAKAGMTPEAIRAWTRHSEPKLYGIEACFNVLGYYVAVHRRTKE